MGSTVSMGSHMFFLDLTLDWDPDIIATNPLLVLDGGSYNSIGNMCKAPKAVPCTWKWFAGEHVSTFLEIDSTRAEWSRSSPTLWCKLPKVFKVLLLAPTSMSSGSEGLRWDQESCRLLSSYVFLSLFLINTP